MSEMKLKEHVAVVTGGGSGIGAEICRRFASEGARVGIIDLNLEQAELVAGEIRGAGGTARAWKADVAEREAVEAVANSVETELGPLTLWVNNAGVSIIVPFLECTDKTWDVTQRVNLKGAFIGSQVAIKRMVPRKRGVVLNMSSQSGKVGNTHYAAYCASKFGIIGLTQSLAVEFAGAGIRVNALCPGVVFTPLWETMIEDYAAKRNMTPEEVWPHFEGKIPLRRLCTAEDVAGTALFLASDAAAYITGQAINISGGAVMN